MSAMMNGLDSTLNKFPAGAHVHPCLLYRRFPPSCGYLGLPGLRCVAMVGEGRTRA